MTMTRRQIVRAPRRARQWAITQNSVSVVAATEAAKAIVSLQDQLEIALAFNLHNTTVSAIRLRLDFHYPSGSTIGDLTRATYGIIWASNDAITAGAASLPNPGVDHSDWVAHGGVSFISESTAAHRPRFSSVMIINDSMRKQRENATSLVLIIAAHSFASSFTIHVTGRVLFLLP